MKMHVLLALAALAGSATLASAEARFSLSQAQQRNSIVELGPIVTDRAATVEIYSLHAGKTGPLIGTEALHAGANDNVRVALSSLPMKMALAAIVVDGQVVATQRIRFTAED